MFSVVKLSSDADTQEGQREKEKKILIYNVSKVGDQWESLTEFQTGLRKSPVSINHQQKWKQQWILEAIVGGSFKSRMM